MLLPRFDKHSRSAILCIVLWFTHVPSALTQQNAGEHSDAHGSACTVHEMSRVILTVGDNREIYVEPETFSVSGSSFLLAGTPNYLWKRMADGGAVLEARDGLFGAVIARDGTAQVVPLPIDGITFVGARAVERKDGGWWIVFAELEQPRQSHGDEMVANLWFGVFDGRSWILLEKLPFPPGAKLRPFNSSALVRRGDSLAWSILTAPDLGDLRTALVYERVGGHWSYDIVPTHNAAYVDLAYSRRGELVLAVVEPDTALSVDENSLFLYARQPDWRQWQKLAAGANGPVHHPKLSLSARGDVVTWWSEVGDRWEVRARFGPIDGGREYVIRVDPDMAQFLLVSTPHGRRIWVTDHLVSPKATRELRFFAEAAQGVSALGHVPNPYEGKFNALAPASSEILLAGPLRGRMESDPIVRTLLLRIHSDCGAKTH